MVAEGGEQDVGALLGDVVAVEDDRVQARQGRQGEVELHDVDEGPTLREHFRQKLAALVTHVQVGEIQHLQVRVGELVDFRDEVLDALRTLVRPLQHDRLLHDFRLFLFLRVTAGMRSHLLLLFPLLLFLLQNGTLLGKRDLVLVQQRGQLGDALLILQQLHLRLRQLRVQLRELLLVRQELLRHVDGFLLHVSFLLFVTGATQRARRASRKCCCFRIRGGVCIHPERELGIRKANASA